MTIGFGHGYSPFFVTIVRLPGVLTAPLTAFVHAMTIFFRQKGTFAWEPTVFAT
jgi:hypothetical protein